MLGLMGCGGQTEGASADNEDGEPHYATGLVFDEAKYRKLPLKAQMTRGLYGSLPASFSLKPYCPTPGNQREYGTCVGWSAAYGARTILEAVANEYTGQQITANAFAPAFTYRLIAPDDYDCQYGSHVEDALASFVGIGAVKLSSLPDLCLGSELPDALVQATASDYKIKDYKRLFDKDDSRAFKVDAIKQSIVAQRPVVIGMTCCEASFQNLRKDCWDDIRYTPFAAGHAMCIVGYDNTYCKGGAFQVLNSWGTNWGNKGFFWLPYEAMSLVHTACEPVPFERLTPAPQPEPEPVPQPEPIPAPQPQPEPAPAPPRPAPVVPELKASIRLALTNGTSMPVQRASQGSGSGTPDLMNARYQTQRAYPSGTLFRFYLRNDAPAYVYALATDNTGRVTRIFPFDARISPELSGGSEIAFPDESQNMIRMDQVAGTDLLCVLVSKEPLPFEQLYSQLQGATTQDFAARLQRSLGNRLGGSAAVDYSPDQIAFRTRAEGNRVIPILITIPHE